MQSTSIIDMEPKTLYNWKRNVQRAKKKPKHKVFTFHTGTKEEPANQ
jgi:hypothetical protein